jgi:hypothetical protein
MLQATTIDSRRTDPNGDLDARSADIRLAAHPDFARGQRSHLDRALVAGDFATCMRSASRPTVTGDYATGMRSSHGPITTGDFATGMRAVPTPATAHDLTSDRDNELPLAA